MEIEFAAVQRDVAYLMDRAAIMDCIARHARGCDRHDADLIATAYHADGCDEHGKVTNLGAEYGDWANSTHASTSQVHTHNITTHSCEIDGDVAHAESYSVSLFLDPDGHTARMIAGRYADRLERRSGEWKIALRRTTVDILMIGEASLLTSEAFHAPGYVKGMRNKRDVCYQRPLTLDETRRTAGEPVKAGPFKRGHIARKCCEGRHMGVACEHNGTIRLLPD
jgi:hypothetical protein